MITPNTWWGRLQPPSANSSDYTYGPSVPRFAGGCFKVILLFVFFFLLLSLLGSNFGTMILGF